MLVLLPLALYGAATPFLVLDWVLARSRFILTYALGSSRRCFYGGFLGFFSTCIYSSDSSPLLLASESDRLFLLSADDWSLFYYQWYSIFKGFEAFL